MIDRTVIPSGNSEAELVQTITGLVGQFQENGLDHRAALKKAARELGLSRDEAYRRLVAERGTE